MAFTIAPLHNLKIDPDLEVPFANGIVFKKIPDWVKQEQFLQYLSFHDRQSVLRDNYAFVAEYDAKSIGEHDPASGKKNPKTIQQTKSQAVLLASLALWLRQPTNVCYTVVFHGLPWDVPGKEKKVNVIQQSETQTPIYCHPNDDKNRISDKHVLKAAELHHVLCSIPRDNPVWVAMRALWAGLTSYTADFRYTLFWIGLEALFGAEDNVGEISFRLAQRVGMFLGRDPDEARDLYRKTKKCYGVRSKIVHGRWKNNKEINERMADTEAIFRTSFRHLIDSPGLLRTFISKHRDKFLDDWVFSRSTDPPPFP